MLVVAFKVLRFGVDGHVIHVNCEPPFGYFTRKDCIHHSLKGCGRVRESEKHYGRFEQSFVRQEGGFPFVSFLDADVVVTPAYVEFGV
jgi:hypothetical protein